MNEYAYQDEADLEMAREQATRSFVLAVRAGKPETRLQIADMEGMFKTAPLLQLLTWIGQDEAQHLLRACSLALTETSTPEERAVCDKQALQHLREFVFVAAREYADCNVGD